MNRLIILIASLLVLAILAVPLFILWSTLTAPDESPHDGLLTLNTKDSTRFTAETPGEMSVAVSRALFPDGSNVAIGGVVRVPVDSWQASVAAAPLVRWLNGSLLLDDGSQDVDAEIECLKPRGVTRSSRRC